MRNLRCFIHHLVYCKIIDVENLTIIGAIAVPIILQNIVTPSKPLSASHEVPLQKCGFCGSKQLGNAKISASMKDSYKITETLSVDI